MKAGLRNLLSGLGAILFLALAWEALSYSQLVDQLLAPPLNSIFSALWRELQKGKLVGHAELTLIRAGLGFAGAVLAGIVLGSAMALSGRFEASLEPIFSFGYPIPKIALYPIFAFLFGLGTGPKIAVVFLESLYPVAIGIYQGLKAISPVDIDAARTMGANRRQIYFKVLTFRAAPAFMSSLRISAHVALATTIILEMIGDSTGLGYYITYTAASFDFDASFAAILMTVAIGFTIDRALVLLRRVVVFWDRDP
jgi:NitT/TauT family transport system permease protein